MIRACTSNLQDAINACRNGTAEINVLDEALARTSTMLGPLHNLFSLYQTIEEAKELRSKLLEWVEVVALLVNLLERSEENYLEFAAVTMQQKQ